MNTFFIVGLCVTLAFSLYLLRGSIKTGKEYLDKSQSAEARAKDAERRAALAEHKAQQALADAASIQQEFSMLKSRIFYADCEVKTMQLLGEVEQQDYANAFYAFAKAAWGNQMHGKRFGDMLDWIKSHHHGTNTATPQNPVDA